MTLPLLDSKHHFHFNQFQGIGSLHIANAASSQTISWSFWRSRLQTPWVPGWIMTGIKKDGIYGSITSHYILRFLKNKLPSGSAMWSWVIFSCHMVKHQLGRQTMMSITSLNSHCFAKNSPSTSSCQHQWSSTSHLQLHQKFSILPTHWVGKWSHATRHHFAKSI